MKPTFRALRIYVFLKSRIVSDIIAWLLFFLLTLGYWGLNHIFQEVPKLEIPNTTAAFFSVFVKNSLIYTFIMMLPVYANLCLLKPYLLDKKFNKILRYGLYLFGTLILAFLTAWGLYHLTPAYLVLKNSTEWLIDMPVVFGTQLIAVGLLYLREFQSVNRKNHSLELQKAKARKILKQKENDLEEIKLSFALNHIKVGKANSYDLIKYEDILYMEADGNHPIIYSSKKKTGFYQTTYSLKELVEKLPKNLFLQVQKKFVVNKTKVKARKIIGSKPYFLLEGTDARISIGGEKFQLAIDKDEYLGF